MCHIFVNVYNYILPVFLLGDRIPVQSKITLVSGKRVTSHIHVQTGLGLGSSLLLFMYLFIHVCMLANLFIWL